MADSRFTPEAAATLRAAIRDAGGVEVFAVGRVDAARRVCAVEIHARGTVSEVNALPRGRSGEVVIHNHPSGELRPSAPDLAIAGRFGEDGVGFVIVDNAVTASTWVVEPHARHAVPVESAALVRFFEESLPAVLSGWEARPGQASMATTVAEGLHVGGTRVLEAGTGTGKSLAYAVPAAMWALANDAKVVLSTHTRTLQAQLIADDLPLLRRGLGGAGLRTAVLKGRANYVCRRKLELAMAGEPSDGLRRLAAWYATSTTGDLSEFVGELDDEDRERIESDSDQTLRARCPHFNVCSWYQARREAAAAHVVVVNHALLLADLSLKRAEAPGILPAFDRVVLDEAHHLEQVATGAAAVRLGERGIARAVAPLLARGGRPGALERLADRFDEAAAAAHEAEDAVLRLRDLAGEGFAALGEDVPVALRVDGAPPHAAFFEALGDAAAEVAGRLGAIEAIVERSREQRGGAVSPVLEQAVLDLARARRRLEEHAQAAHAFLLEDAEACRYLEPGARGVVAVRAPIDVGPIVRALLVERTVARVFTSATLAVNGRIDHWLGRVGLVPARPGDADDEAADDAGAVHFGVYPSPFRYEEQALLGLPRDLPPPDADGWLQAATEATVRAVRASGGGAFVLCTSHEAVAAFGAALEQALGARHAILRQGRGNRERLLARFREDRASVLVGTDSFWEGVSVKGDALRLVVIPRLPFRVPTEPVAAARHERLRARGQDPFRAFSLPEAVLKLRQGFGRLIRTGSDRGVVLLLDRRIHEAWYGRVFLASLPPARRSVGPLRAVLGALETFYGP
jgi:ATP-dependent DNA helicase DinG